MKTNKKVVLGTLVLAGLLALFPLASLSSQSKDDDGTVILSKDNTLVLNQEVNGDSVGALISQARKLDAELSKNERFKGDKKHLVVFLNTPGGSIQSGLELIEAFQGLNRKTDTVTLFAASMGFQIAQNLDCRYILKNGVLMSHHAAGEFQGSFGGIAPSQLDSRYQLWLDRVRELDEQTVKRTNGKQTYKSYTEAYDHEIWMTGQKSVALGYADQVVKVRCDKSLEGTSVHHASFMGLDIQYELDNCPINSSPLNVHIAGEATLSREFTENIKNQFLSKFEMKNKAASPFTW